MNCGTALVLRCSHCQAKLPENARYCPQCGRPLFPKPRRRPGAAGDTTALVGERKQLTVLFADIPGFTGLVGKLDAEEVHDLMNSLWAKLDEVINRYDGVVDKHIGDAVMALFGTRTAREEDPEHAVRAALEMRACVRGFTTSSLMQPLQIRLGLHTGPVFIGPVGTTREFTATGDVVNLASRLEHEASADGILISHDTYEQVRGLFDVEVLPPLVVRGRDTPLQVYRVLQAKPRPLALRARGIEGIERQMIGRQTELQTLKDVLQSVLADQRARVVSILGEPGIGKSCLVQEFQRWVELLPQRIRLFSGRASRDTSHQPFALLRDLLCVRFAVQETDPPPVARRKLEEGLAGLARAGQPLTETPFLGHLLGLSYADDQRLQEALADPDAVRHRAFNCLGSFFEMVSRASALPGEQGRTDAAMLVLEDVHWSDSDSLAAVEHIVRSCARAPVMVLCVARPSMLERFPGWGDLHADYQRITLSSLSATESRRLVETILRKTPQIPQSLPELVVSRAEGNPYWIEEIIKMLIDEQVILAGPERWRIRAESLAATDIPKTLTGVLQARLDSLTPGERTVLQRAAVVGRTFWDAALAWLDDAPGNNGGEPHAVGGRDRIAGALAALQRKDLIYPSTSSAFAGTLEYAFRHELLRNVAYEGLSRRVRSRYHGSLAVWLIRQGGERVQEFAAVVAGHFEEAKLPVEAAKWFGRAADHARMGHAPAAAIQLYRKALALLPAESPAESRLGWLEGLSETLGARAHFDEAIEVCGQALQVAEMATDLTAQARLWNSLAFLHERRGDNHGSIRDAERAIELAQRAGDNPGARSELTRALYLKGWAYYRLANAPAVLALADETAQLCAQTGNRQGMARSHKLRGVANLQLGNIAAAVESFEAGLALFQEIGDKRNAAAMWSNLGEAARMVGDFARAAELYETALQVSREIGNRESELIYLGNLAGARLGLRQYAQAEADLRQVIAMAQTEGTCSLAETYSFLSKACSGLGRFNEAWDAAQHSLKLAGGSDNFLDLGGAWRALAVAAEGLQRNGATPSVPTGSSPATYYEESLRVYRQIGALVEQARTLKAWGDYETRAGLPEAGRKLVDEAGAIAGRLGISLPIPYVAMDRS